MEDRLNKIANDLKEAAMLADKLEEKMLQFQTTLLLTEIYEELNNG